MEGFDIGNKDCTKDIDSNPGVNGVSISMGQCSVPPTTQHITNMLGSKDQAPGSNELSFAAENNSTRNVSGLSDALESHAVTAAFETNTIGLVK